MRGRRRADWVRVRGGREGGVSLEEGVDVVVDVGGVGSEETPMSTYLIDANSTE